MANKTNEEVRKKNMLCALHPVSPRFIEGFALHTTHQGLRPQISGYSVSESGSQKSKNIFIISIMNLSS